MDSSLQKAPYCFDFRFVANDDEVRRLLVAQTCNENRDVILIAHPDDLSQANLVSRFSIADDGRHTLGSGKLFESSKPLTLVMDIRKLTSDELPRFNDLLDPDNPCLYDQVSQKKRPLGEHVSLLVLAAPAQLASVGQLDEAPGADAPGADAPGADFWRRVNRPENTWQFEAKTGNDPSMKIDKVPPVLTELPYSERAMDDNNTVLIDCHMHSHWRQLLLGGPGVDQQGRIRHIPGRLESLRAGHRVILKGANWQDLAFEQTIRQILAQQYFESNGKVCQLPDDVRFYRMPVGNDELHSLFQSLSRSRDKKGYKEGDKGPDNKHASSSPIIINQSNIAEWLSPIAIAPGGYVAPNTCLLEQIRAGGAVTVTSPLTEALWFRLLGSLQTIRETTGMQPRLQLTHSKQQPKALGVSEKDEHPLFNVRGQSGFSAVSYQQHAQASHWINSHQEAPLVIQVNDQTRFSQLFDNIYITSEQKAHFGRRQSDLQKALSAGKPVVFRGLDTNPRLQQILEPLMLGQPLLVNGQLQAYPQAHVTLLWPESAKSASSVLRSMITRGNPCPQVNLWDINALKYDISRAELPEQALHSLYEAFETVPAHLCNPLPEMTEGLLSNLILAARQAQQVDRALQLLPCHWRKAINSVITHGTRQHLSVRDFMKVACWHLLPDKTPDKNQTASVDPDHLNDIINRSLRLNRAFVEQNLWHLARAFDPAVFNGELQLSYKSPFRQGDKEALDRLCAMIVAHVPEHLRDAMAHQLQVGPEAAEQYQAFAVRPARQIKRLQDALACGWQLPLPSGQTRSDAIHALACDCYHIGRTTNSEAAGIERIKHRLSESLKWTGSTDRPLSALAHDLYHGEMSQKDRESRRLYRLHDRLTDSPVIFLEGETGTGKSYFSAKMARASGQAAVISLGPSDSEQTLMKCWQWQEHDAGDRSMAQQNRALMEWANTGSDKDGGYVTLVLDEANLAKAELLASLNGLWEPKPCIYVNGHPVPVSTKHRVILTGNPEHYAGRQLDPALKEKLPRVHYPRLDLAFLRDRVVEPALINQLQRHQINDIAHSATKSVMALWRYYPELLPEHEFTPRDLTDICSWVGWYLDRALSKGDSVSCEQVNSLIQQSFRDLLGTEISEAHQDALAALEIWFAARYPLDNTLSDNVRIKNMKDIQQPFMQFTEKNRPEFDTSVSAVIDLVQRLGQDLSRCQQAYHRKIKHDGRQATLIEGPAGRGKDVTLNLMIESVRQQAEQRGESMPDVFLLNACDCSWDKVCEAIRKAKMAGGIVVISEMNLIDSQHLEGELNDILAGDAHPGFHLFATINPPENSGRKPLSPALKGRFRHLPIRQYNQTELQTIAEKVLPQTTEGKFAAEKLTQLHCRLRADLQRKNLPLQPTSRDLQNVARAVARGGDFSDNGLHQYLNQHYRLYLMTANLSLDKLPESSTLAMGKGVFDSGLCEWFNQTVPNIDRPWMIRLSHLDSIDEKNHEIRIKARPSKEEVKAEIIKRVAQARWRASGLPLKPDQSHDILTRALYRYWQKSWFDRQFGRSGVDANSVFPLTKEEKQTLKMPANQSYLREADQQISTWNSNAVQWWPAFWHQMSAQPDHRADDCEKYNPQAFEKQSEVLDWNTDYENQKKPVVDDYKVFNTQTPPSRMYRWWAKDIYVTPEGDIKLIEISDKHIQRVEALMPERLPGQGQEVRLASNQTLATLKMSSKNGQYPLPSLTPEDYIVALRIEPDLAFTLIRDRYTGLHLLTIPEAKAKQSIQVAYVVEPDKKTPTKGARPERSILFDHSCSEGMTTVLDKLFKTTGEQTSEVKVLLETIKDTKNTAQRIEAIKDYCQQFSGKAISEPGKNFFEFLVTQRQGRCCHRVPVFIAFCRYFGIPCRQINSRTHSFAEYSVDDRQTWNSVNLGGAPTERKEIKPAFQPHSKFPGSNTALKQIKNLLKGADSAQLQTLAKACGISLEELKKALETNSVLPETDLSISQIVNNLWKAKNLTAFSMGISVIESLGTEVLVSYEEAFKWIAEAVIKILSNSDEDKVTEPLKLLHSKLIEQAGVTHDKWLLAIVFVLERSDLTKPSVLQFARKAMALNWLYPVPFSQSHLEWAHNHHELLARLEDIDKLKVEAARCLKKWYEHFLSREKNSQSFRLPHKRLREKEGSIFFITDSHDGFSPFLEDNIVSSSIRTAWTDQPGGIPNIERMLLHHPAFVQLNTGKDNHRPVIILGQPDWYRAELNEMTDVLFQRKVKNSPKLQQSLKKMRPESVEVQSEDQKLLDDLKNKCMSAILQAFTYYLYQVTHLKGGCLSFCWGDACVAESENRGYYGAHDPSSPEMLFAMMCNIDSSVLFQKSVKDAYLMRAQKVNNALILKSREMTTILEEFLSSVNLNSIYGSLDS
ncbi:AAA family ATPase [Endozoicomonas sp. 8E]|uniref:AAA family ATPase n=1 Tax=Endozoicomonas sp. 8E TaxID=3035692 RepID=UPI002938DBF3|nr:AAA family ATPase [Endozoicomonas sp. 8E]WOG28880.1 AAA family ATPase [Endozoicomonas sp. 8E]